MFVFDTETIVGLSLCALFLLGTIGALCKKNFASAIVFAVPIAIFVYSMPDHARMIGELRTYAPTASAYGIANFDRLDANHDGMVTSEEMLNFEGTHQLSGEDRRTIGFMVRRIYLIGHRLPRFQEAVFGVTRNEFRTFPKRV